MLIFGDADTSCNAQNNIKTNLFMAGISSLVVSLLIFDSHADVPAEQTSFLFDGFTSDDYCQLCFLLWNKMSAGHLKTTTVKESVNNATSQPVDTVSDFQLTSFSLFNSVLTSHWESGCGSDSDAFCKLYSVLTNKRDVTRNGCVIRLSSMPWIAKQYNRKPLLIGSIPLFRLF